MERTLQFPFLLKSLSKAMLIRYNQILCGDILPIIGQQLRFNRICIICNVK